MKPVSSEAVNILIVEDNRIDARLITHAIKQVQDWVSRSVIIEDGEKAIGYLLGEGEYGNEPKPDLMILDLNLPKRDGTEVLRAIRENDRYRNLPVFILSSSPLDISERQVRTANLQADGYFVKPFEVGNYFGIAQQIYERYLSIQLAKSLLRARPAAK